MDTKNFDCYVDVHSHLTDEVFTEDIEQVISEAKKVGVAASLVVAENEDQYDKVLSLADRFPDFVLPCLGVHPVQGDPTQERRSANMQDITNTEASVDKHHGRLGAVGEVGLDFTPRFCGEEGDKEMQKLVLARQVEIAQKYDLPLNVHSRSAGRPTIALLKELGATKVLMHAFDGKPSVGMEGVKAGFYFSVPPSVTRTDDVSPETKREVCATDSHRTPSPRDRFPCPGPCQTDTQQPVQYCPVL
ncbi:putative deoxyribonuclease TATDN3 isoform X2 [Haliotis rubra]|uniref:putative deoxyribonuclease TATDN3 isoform X2 n=1 Tax=Haliotis rubra TaxID=36100 RepID=UPI001EE61F83|nr:putative deoxyribonuclease TATDN3 isoform X2 [Haliotis rubra]